MESRTPYLNPGAMSDKRLLQGLSFPAGKMGIISTPLSEYVHVRHSVLCWVEDIGSRSGRYITEV